jgi:hypothetical protein
MCVASPLSKILWLFLPSQPTKALVDEEDRECRIVVMSQDDIRNMPVAKQFVNTMKLKFGKQWCEHHGRMLSHGGSGYTDWPAYVGDDALDRSNSKKRD